MGFFEPTSHGVGTVTPAPVATASRCVAVARNAATFVILGCLLAAGCETTNGDFSSDLPEIFPPRETSRPVAAVGPVRVYRNPYEAVDWSNDLRLLAQHHDHIAMRSHYILAYDVAGYDVVSLMDYSGNREFFYAYRQRVWPASEWVPRDVFVNLKSIKLFLPNAEEVGIEQKFPWDPLKHATSPFLTTYIEGAPKTLIGAPELPLQPNQYRTVEQLFALVRANGGFPCLAHPWNYRYENADLGDAYCVEIYNALGEAQKEQGFAWFTDKDRNEMTLAAWDQALIRNQRVLGIAVNDHFGPYTAAGVVSNRVRDSGKIVVLAKGVTLAAYRSAFEAGSFFAVRDYGEIKNRYPRVHSITVDDGFIYLETTNTVKWIADGEVVGNQPMLRYANLSHGVRYLRAEIADAVGSTLYTQAFPVRPVGDVDGDYHIDAADEELCVTERRSPSNVVAQRACAAVTVSP